MNLDVLTTLSDGAARSLAKAEVVECAKVRLLAAVFKGKAVLMSLALGASLSLPVFAEGEGDSDVTGLVASTDTIVTMVGKVWTLMMSNPLLKTYVGAGLLSVGIGFFLYLKKAARH